ncbi:MAG: hypothetical protein K2X47_14765 [Bdellovibrionales bacterium]|nr:hypothetical protein [Bdellovibrionales bacterium]
MLNWAIGIFLALALVRFVSSPQPSEGNESETDLSTSIPRGYVIVPIELQNSVALEGILGDVGGYVDLYESSERGQGKKIAHHIKLVRAPKDPRQFAVLAKENQAPDIVKHDGPLIATMRNPEDKGSASAPRSQTKTKIFYGDAGSESEVSK